MKKTLTIAAIVAGAIFVYGRNKVKDISSIFKKLQIKITGVKNLSIGFAGISLNLDIQITNPTSTPLLINTGGAATLKRLIYKDAGGNFLGESFPNLTEIEIPAGATINILDIPTTVMANNIGSTINSILDIFKNPQSLQVSAEIETPAGTYLI